MIGDLPCGHRAAARPDADSTAALVSALRSFEAKRRGKPVVVDARDFFYSRISMAMGDDVVLEILDGEGNCEVA